MILLCRVRIRLLSGDSDEALARLRTGQAELALVGARPDDDSLSSRAIGGSTP